MTSTQTSGYSLLHRTAIAVCLGTGLFFAFRAATPDARATATVQAVAVSPTVDAAVPTAELTTCNIEDIQAGDLVLARDQHGQEIGLKPVKEVYKRTSFHLRHLTFESADGDQQTLSTTDEHPFWSVTADEFVEAGSLPVGHKVTDPHGKTQTLVRSTREEFPNGIPVFNFQVEDFHTYYVAAYAGDDVLLVHNADCNLNANDAVGHFGLYEIGVNGNTFKVGKADLDRVTKSSGLPTRLHQQVRKLGKIFGPENVSGKVVEDLGTTTTELAKKAEYGRIGDIFRREGMLPLGNWRSWPK